MPELPEVQTIVDELNLKVKGKTILKSLPAIKNIKNKKILNIRRRAKYIIFELSDNYILLIHLKMTGHLLLGKWEMRDNIFYPISEGPLKEDRFNQYVRTVFYLDNDFDLGFSDLRKFGQIELFKKEEFEKLEKINKLGVEPFSKDFTFKFFKGIIKNTKTNIKKLLMDQEKIAGIGNIYASEILFCARVSPLRNANSLSENEMKRIYEVIKLVLKKAIDLKGSSAFDYRRTDGIKGFYQEHSFVYGRRGEECLKCKGKVEYVKIGQRGTYFCPKCQK